MAESSVACEVAAGEGIYLAVAAKLFPSHREGRSVSGSCVFRWCTDGIKSSDGRRVFLEHVRLAGRILTAKVQRELRATAKDLVKTLPAELTDDPAKHWASIVQARAASVAVPESEEDSDEIEDSEE